MTNFSDMLSKAKAMQEKMKEVQDQIKKIKMTVILAIMMIKKDVIKNLTVIKEIIEIENQRLNQMVTKIQETDTKNLILNLMRLSKVKGFLILCRMVMVF